MRAVLKRMASLQLESEKLCMKSLSWSSISELVNAGR
jgi:hypothetical protein